MSKSRDAFRTISEVSDELDTPAHVLRFWESKFTQVKPVKRAGGRRYYRPADVDLLAGIKQLLHDDGMTIKGAQKLLREKGVKHVGALGAASLTAEVEMSNAGADAIETAPAPERVQKPENIAEPEVTPDIVITNVVALPSTPPSGPALTLNLAPKPEAPDVEVEVEVEAASDPVEADPVAETPTIEFAADPSDSDSKAPARLFHLLHKAPHDKLAAQAEAIAPLLDRMQVLRDRISLR